MTGGRGSGDTPASGESGRKTWEAGDFSRVATGLTIVGEMLCEAVVLHARERVLDVATGSGNTALAAARRRAVVTGIDFVPSLLARARERAEAERLELDLQEGSAEALPCPDSAFDCVLSTFGVMFAADQAQAARELVRVCRPGGRIGLTCWTPAGFTGTLFRTVARLVPALKGIFAATRWGTEDGLRELFPGAGVSRTVVGRQAIMRADSPEAYVGFFRKYFGPTVTAFAALDPEGQGTLERELLEVVHGANRATDGTTFIPSDYLEIVLHRN